METITQSNVQQLKICFTPNPATDQVQISGIEGNVKLVISDMHCRVLITQNIVCDDVVCLKSLTRGIYIAKLISPNGKIERRKLEKK
jgi:hypothetical protein